MAFAFADGDPAMGDPASHIAGHADGGGVVGSTVPYVDRDINFFKWESPQAGDEAHVPGEAE